MDATGLHRIAGQIASHPWPALDLVLWACVVTLAGLDIVTTVVALEAGIASEGNAVGAHAFHAAGAEGLLRLKLAALFTTIIAWAAVPWRWRPYVRAGTVAGGLITGAAVANNAWILMAA